MTAVNPGPASSKTNLTTAPLQVSGAAQQGSFFKFASLPTSARAGDWVYTSDEGMCFFNGSTWIPLTQFSVPIAAPAGFRYSPIPINLRRTTGGVITTDFDITTLIPVVAKIYYVNPISGSDANAGTTPATALQHLSTALAKSDVDQVQIIGLTGDFIARTTFSWNNIQTTRSVSVLNRTGYRYISTEVSSSVAPTWTVNGTYSNVYQTTISAANSASVVDLLTSSTLSYPNSSGVSVSLPNVPKRFRTLVQVSSIAAVAATPGTFYNDATNTYVQSYDGRNLVGDQYMTPCGSSNNGRFPSVNNCVIYIENIDFVGGRPFYMLMASSVTGTVLALNTCSFQGSSVTGSGGFNGLTVQCFGTVYAVNCGAYDNGLDGFNYHSNESDGTTSGTSPSVVEIGCASVGNGLTGSGGSSDNASTSHDFCNVIRVNCVYINTADRTVIDIDSAQSWNLGCYVGPSIIGTTGGENIVSGGGVSASTTKMWIDTCYAAPGAFPRWASITPSGGQAFLYYYNSGAVVNDLTNTGYVGAYLG